jgi:hypothetical protein
MKPRRGKPAPALRALPVTGGAIRAKSRMAGSSARRDEDEDDQLGTLPPGTLALCLYNLFPYWPCTILGRREAFRQDALLADLEAVDPKTGRPSKNGEPHLAVVCFSLQLQPIALHPSAWC